MILVSLIVPALMLCLVFLYLVLFRQFYMIKSKLPVFGFRGAMGGLNGKHRKLAVWGILIFVLGFAGQMATQLYAPSMLMVFNYEEAARGQNPNATRFNESVILSDRILEKVVRRGGLALSADQLADFLTISTPLDAEKLDVTQESALKISTEYWIHCSEKVSLYGTTPKAVLNFLADVYWEDFTNNYAENDKVLDLSFDGLEGMEYLDVKDYLQMQPYKLKNYLPGYSSERSSFRAEGSEETFPSLSQKIDNFIEIELERYEAFILEKGLSRHRNTYQSRMQYANRLLDTDQKKDMAAHDVRIEAIDMYNAFMTRFVLIPTYDTDQEFYMSRTKVGVDYFADEAKELLESATKLLEEIEHNSYASGQVVRSRAGDDVYAQADEKIGELNAELQNLSAQCRQLCDAYVREKRDGYIQVSFATPSVPGNIIKAFLITILYLAVWIGLIVLQPYYAECTEAQAAGRKAQKLARKEYRKNKKEFRKREKAEKRGAKKNGEEGTGL